MFIWYTMTLLHPMQCVQGFIPQGLKRLERKADLNLVQALRMNADLNLLFIHAFALRIRSQLPLSLPLSCY